jgi:hypothetical protein
LIIKLKVKKRFIRGIFALYQPAGRQSALERRKELLNKRGEKIYLSPKYLKFVGLPKKALRAKIDELKEAFAHGENIVNQNRARELKKILERSCS